MSLRRKFVEAKNRLLWGMPNRYGHLRHEIIRCRCRSILEIGVWRGEHSRQMIEAALEGHVPAAEIRYYGIDLFENADSSMVSREASKFPPALDSVRTKLHPYVDRGVHIDLMKGDSTEILPEMLSGAPRLDLVFIDGGHSYETVKSDWECVKRMMHAGTIVIFDDYVNEEAVRNTKVGVNDIVDGIDRRYYDVVLLKPIDSFKKEWGTLEVRLAKVTLKSGESVALR